MKLADLQVGIHCLITAVCERSGNVSRLNQLGVIPGCAVEVLRAAPMGDPLQVRVEGTLLSIRKHDAELIQVEHA